MAFLPSALIPSMGGYNPYAMPQYAMSPSPMSGYNPYGMPQYNMSSPQMGNYNPYNTGFPYGQNIPVNDYAAQSAQASRAIQNVRQFTPKPIGDLLDLQDELGQAFGPSDLKSDPAFNAALSALTGRPPGASGSSPAGGSFPNFPLTGRNDDPRRLQFNPSGFPYSNYNPTYPVYPYPMYAGFGQPQYQQNSFGSPYGGYGGFGGYGQFPQIFRFA